MFKKVFEVVKNNKLIVLILALSLLLRLIGTHPGYHPYHSDEGMSYSAAMEMIVHGNIDPKRYDYPSLIPLINAVIFTVIGIPLFTIKTQIFSPELLPMDYKSSYELFKLVASKFQETNLLFWGREVTALFGVGVVFLIYKLVRNLFKDEKIALVTAFLTAVNYRQVLNSHLGLPDIYNSFFLILSMLLTLRIAKKASMTNYLLAGLGMALSFSTKFQIYSVLPFIYVHLSVFWKTKKINDLISYKPLASFLMIPLVFLLVNPYHIVYWQDFVAIVSYVALKYGMGMNKLSLYSLFYLYNVGIGKILFLLIPISFVLSLIKYPRQTIFLLCAIFPFLFTFAFYSTGGFYTRNYVTITPFLLIFPALTISTTLDKIKDWLKIKNLVIFFVLCLVTISLISYDQIKNSLILTYSYTKEWNFILAKNWAAINLPEGATILTHPWDKYPTNKNLKVVPYDAATIFSIAEMQEEGIDYGYINLDWTIFPSYWWMKTGPYPALFYMNKEKINTLFLYTITGGSAREMATWSIASFVKPWQAPDMNFLIIKVPPKIEIGTKKLIASYSFPDSKSLDNWKYMSLPVSRKKIVGYDPVVGQNAPGSLMFNMAPGPSPLRIAMSPPINIDGSHAYMVQGSVRLAEALKKEHKNGIIRIDFFADDPSNVEIGKIRSLSTNVSSRVWGNSGWIKKEVVAIPPPGAKYLTVSFQTDNMIDEWVDDINVYESEIEYKYPQIEEPYSNYQIPLDILFPYSQAGL